MYATQGRVDEKKQGKEDKKRETSLYLPSISTSRLVRQWDNEPRSDSLIEESLLRDLAKGTETMATHLILERESERPWCNWDVIDLISDRVERNSPPKTLTLGGTHSVSEALASWKKQHVGWWIGEQAS
ncbi:hypothetical protein Tco_1000169 [Tanacetum coccineum]